MWKPTCPSRICSGLGQQAVLGGLKIENVNFVTMPNKNVSCWSRTYHNYQSYVTPIASELLDLVNNELSPYVETFTMSDLDIMSVNSDGSVSSSTGHGGGQQGGPAAGEALQAQAGGAGDDRPAGRGNGPWHWNDRSRAPPRLERRRRNDWAGNRKLRYDCTGGRQCRTTAPETGGTLRYHGPRRDRSGDHTAGDR